MTNQTTISKAGDASGRGSVSGYKVNFPARMRAYTEAEINAIVNVMRNAEVQTREITCASSRRISRLTQAQSTLLRWIIAPMHFVWLPRCAGWAPRMK